VTAVASGDRATVAVCGGGLIGTSLALGLGAQGHAVRVCDVDASVRAALRDILDASAAGASVTVHDDWSVAATGADIIIAAVPPAAIPEVLVTGSRHAADDALLTDVAGVKDDVVRRVSAALSAGGVTEGVLARFVGGHPMAGSERSGPGAGDAALFSGATWVLTPTPASSDASLARAGELARGLGARVLVLSPTEHDTIVGLVSHLPQLVASVLADVAADAVGADRDAVMAVAGPGFRDTTRIAASDAELWLEILDGNREAVSSALDAFRARLDVVAEALGARDGAALGEVLRRASAARRRLVPKAMEEPTRDLIIPLRDRPGEIARIAGALGSAGINIEDLAMRHASAADRGSLLLRVRAEHIDRAVGVLGQADVDGVVVERDPATPVPTSAATPVTPTPGSTEEQR
jgi:prephenate dehydrogenase